MDATAESPEHRPIGRERRSSQPPKSRISCAHGTSLLPSGSSERQKKAAELLSLAEAVRAGLIGNPTRDVTGLVRLEGEARRTLRLLGIKTEPVPKTRALERARARWAAQEQQAKAKARGR